MAFKDNSVKVLFGGLGMILIILGLVSFGIDALSWLRPVILLTAGLVLFTELTVKKVTNASTLRTFGVQQWATLAVGIVLLLAGILSMPVIAFEWAFITQASGYALMLGGVLAFGEALLPFTRNFFQNDLACHLYSPKVIRWQRKNLEL
jgi:uncharacterized membrane protein HdeD (DUF308 family)